MGRGRDRGTGWEGIGYGSKGVRGGKGERVGVRGG